MMEEEEREVASNPPGSSVVAARPTFSNTSPDAAAPTPAGLPLELVPAAALPPHAPAEPLEDPALPATPRTAAKSTVMRSAGPMEVLFRVPGSLGLQFANLAEQVSIKIIHANKQAAMVNAKAVAWDEPEPLQVGMVVAAVGYPGVPPMSTDRLGYAAVIGMLRQKERPLTVRFAPPKSELRAEIDRLYGLHNPAKLLEVDGLSAKYGEPRLLAMVKKKYGLGASVSAVFREAGTLGLKFRGGPAADGGPHAQVVRVLAINPGTQAERMPQLRAGLV